MAVATKTPRGRNFVRSIMAQVIAKNSPAEYAAKRWGRYEGEIISKAVVEAIVSGEVGYLPTEFFDALKGGAIIGKIGGWREVDFNVRALAASGSATAYWMTQAAPKPISKTTLTGAELRPATVAGIVVVTREALQHGGEATERTLQRDLEAAVIGMLDTSIIDINHTGVAGEVPASLTAGVSPIPATSDCGPSGDVEAMIETFQGDLSAAYFVTDPVTAAQLALARDAGGGPYFIDASVRGGSILGIPLVVSRYSPRDSSGGQLALIDPTAVALALGDIQVSESQHTTLAMIDNPTGAVEQVSMFQTNSVALRVEINANWEVMQEGAVSILTGTDWTGCGA